MRRLAAQGNGQILTVLALLLVTACWVLGVTYFVSARDGVQAGSEHNHLTPVYRDGGVRTQPASAQPGGVSGAALSTQNTESDFRMTRPAIVVLAHNRVDTLSRCLESLMTQPRWQEFGVYVSCDDPASWEKMERVLPPDGSVKLWRQSPDTPSSAFASSGLARIAQHFRQAMDRGFTELDHSHLILIEDDLVLAPDFLEYFLATAWLLDADPTLWCVSAWHDNGLAPIAQDHTRLFRTDYFPGLGWMLKSDLWHELRPKWPRAATTGWDHWMRLSAIRKGRDCIAPEIPRTRHTSTKGVNVNEQSAERFSQYGFSQRKPGAEPGFGDLSHLIEPNYDAAVRAVVEAAPRVTHLNQMTPNADVFVLPYMLEHYTDLARQLNLWEEAPRATYRGLTFTRVRGQSAMLVLADRRRAHALRHDERVRPAPQTQTVPAQRGESCVAACARFGVERNLRQPVKRGEGGPVTWQCRDQELPFVNNCEALAAAFPCQQGCGHQIGLELPAYVVDANEITVGQCLVTDGARATCRAAHMATRRLCPCSPA